MQPRVLLLLLLLCLCVVRAADDTQGLLVPAAAHRNEMRAALSADNMVRSTLAVHVLGSWQLLCAAVPPLLSLLLLLKLLLLPYSCCLLLRAVPSPMLPRPLLPHVPLVLAHANNDHVIPAAVTIDVAVQWGGLIAHGVHASKEDLMKMPYGAGAERLKAIERASALSTKPAGERTKYVLPAVRPLGWHQYDAEGGP